LIGLVAEGSHHSRRSRDKRGRLLFAVAFRGNAGNFLILILLPLHWRPSVLQFDELVPIRPKK